MTPTEETGNSQDRDNATVDQNDADGFKESGAAPVTVRPGASSLKLEVTSLSMVGVCTVHDERGNMLHESGFWCRTVLFVILALGTKRNSQTFFTQHLFSAQTER